MPGAAPAPAGAATPSSACAKLARLPLAEAPIRRLTADEYLRTVRDLLAVPSGATVTLDVPNESRVDGFENNVSVQVLSERHVRGFAETVEGLTGALLADARRRDAVVGCAPSGGARAACTRAFIRGFGRRAFRRPLTAEEIERFAGLAATADGDADPYAGIDLVIRAMLTSSSFVFVMEIGAPDPARPGYLHLSGYELATRLALLILGAGPGDALLDAAAAGTLDTAAGLATTARQLLDDPRAAAVRRELASSWLQLETLAAASPDPKLYRTWTEGLRADMAAETTRFLDALLGGRDGGSLLDLVSADWSYVNDRLARHYGLGGGSAAWVRTSLAGARRGAGLLTQGTFLTMTAPHAGVEPIKRGQYVRQVLLCERLPSPPGDVPGIDEARVSATASDRERLAAHRSNPACGGCHALLDPVGFGFSTFDGVGALRTKDAGGNPIDARGSIAGIEPSEFDGPAELGARLRRSSKLPACIATQLHRFALARTETQEDACAIQAVADGFATGGASYAALIDALVRSDAFRYRRPATTAEVAP